MSGEGEGEVPLGPGREFDAIRLMLDRWGTRARGIGDDAAVLDVPPGASLIASVDASIDGRHFRRDWLTPREIGYRAVAAALSDLAAMAARPLGVLIALGIPDGCREALAEIADGIGEAVDVVSTPILGGNVSGAAELSIVTTVLGEARATLKRSAALPGDRVYVTGRLGGPGAAIAAWAAGREPAPAHRARFAHPVPRMREALWLAEHGARAAIDVSDGLAADVGHLAAASNVAIEIVLEHVPRMDGIDPRPAVASGEEYELVVTAPEPMDVVAFETSFGLPLTDIGRVSAGNAETLLTEGGARVAIPRGYDHFSS